MKNKFYIATPIYYWNWLPHVWHYYSSVIVNTIYKFNKISGKSSRFTTWIDENSQKAVIIAEEKWMKIMDYLDEITKWHKKVWDYFNFDYTDFIRTTEKRHHSIVQDVLQKCFNKGDIYEWEYEWMYCVWCEAFKKDDDLIPHPNPLPGGEGIRICPDHLKEPDKIKEKNYFFKLSKYQKWMEEFHKANPDFVNPDFRFNEVIEFTKRWLEDFSISRENATFWIPLPFDNSQITYVWFDALLFYYTSCKYSRWWDKNNENFINESDFFPVDLHVVWKDIIRFHAIYWPAMLASYFDLWEEKNGILHYKKSDLEKLPKQILTTWFFTVDWQKISKSLWNIIEPVSYSQEYSKELLTLYILSAFPIWNDWDFDREQAILTYNAKLANNLGNLVNRVTVLSLKLEWYKLEWYQLDVSGSNFLKYWYFNSDKLDENGSANVKLNLQDFFNTFLKIIKMEFESYRLKDVLDETFKFLDELNKFTDINEPWKLIKEDEEKTREVLCVIAEWLRQVWLCLYPFFPEKMWEMFTKLGLENYVEQLESWKLQELKERKEKFKIKEKWKNLFERFELPEINESWE